MNSASALEVVHAMVDAWNSGDVSAFLACLSDDIEWADPAMVEPARGPDAVRAFAEAMRKAFPDFRIIVREPVCVSPDGTRCAVPWQIVATQTGRLDPPGFAPTNRRAVFQGVDILEFRADTVSRISTYFDPRIPAEQLLAVTLVPVPGSWREWLVVTAQRLRAAWLRRRRNEQPGR